MILDATEIENSFKVWRAVNMDIAQKTQAELLVFEEVVSATWQCSSIKDIQ